MTSNAPTVEPTPIPAFAPVDNPLLLDIGDAVVGVVVVEGWSVSGVSWGDEEEVVEKSEWSVW
jgi:hypothetical protein